jgi:hypothetical protein
MHAMLSGVVAVAAIPLFTCTRPSTSNNRTTARWLACEVLKIEDEMHGNNGQKGEI